MQKNVQISYDLFMALVRYHCLHDDSQTDMIKLTPWPVGRLIRSSCVKSPQKTINAFWGSFLCQHIVCDSHRQSPVAKIIDADSQQCQTIIHNRQAQLYGPVLIFAPEHIRFSR